MSAKYLLEIPCIVEILAWFGSVVAGGQKIGNFGSMVDKWQVYIRNTTYSFCRHILHD